MTHTITSTLLFFGDLLLPPRKTEKSIRKLTLATLIELASDDNTLPYHDPRITALIWELKYRKNSFALSLAAQFLKEQLLSVAEESLGTPVLIPVPMHKTRQKDRGYNQCELLCEAILKETGDSFAYAPHAIVRTRNTRPQQGLARHRRLLNMKGAMEAAHPELVEGKVCIVIDDVRTTGATSAETRRALLEAGAREVHIMTLAQS